MWTMWPPLPPNLAHGYVNIYVFALNDTAVGDLAILDMSLQ